MWNNSSRRKTYLKEIPLILSSSFAFIFWLAALLQVCCCWPSIFFLPTWSPIKINVVSSAFAGILKKLAQSTDWPDCFCGFPVVLHLFVQAWIASNLAGLGLSLTYSLPLLLLHSLQFCSGWESSVCCGVWGHPQYLGFFPTVNWDGTFQVALHSWE